MTSNSDAERVRLLLAIAEAHGIKRLKVGDIEFELGPRPAPASATGDVEVEGIGHPRRIPIGEAKGAPTEDELLFPPGMAPDVNPDGEYAFESRLPFKLPEPSPKADGA